MNTNHFGISALLHVLKKSSQETRRRVISMYAFLISFNIVVWIFALIAFGRSPSLLLLAGTAYIFGLRHAFDADHISAIDNVTRKLMQEKKRPVGVGFFFSLGHSTIVIVLTACIAVTASALQSINNFKAIGGLIGTATSALFLFVIAVINIIVLVDIYRTFCAVRRGGEYNDQALDESLNKRGLMGRFFRPLLRMTDQSWKMFPVGFLFGLGFDTATEVGLLGMAAATAVKGLPIVFIMIFPLLFTAGMSLMDTTDGVLMLGAYGWAFVKPMRKLYYNLSTTLISVIVALIVGGIEALNILATELNLSGPVWDQIGNLNENFGSLGIIVLLFIASWVVSTLVYKVKGYDELEIRMVSQPNQKM